MKLFITGATGFIGKNLTDHLFRQDYDITINVRKGKKHPFADNIKSYSFGARDIQDDIRFFYASGFAGVIHLASKYVVEHGPKDVAEIIDSNVRLGTCLLECAAQAGVPWFLNTGTFWQHYKNEAYSPVNLYAASKQAFESLAQYYIETGKIRFCTLRLSDTYGPDDTRQKIFSLWDKISRTGETLDMSPGEQLIDISYIDDVINAYDILIRLLLNNANLINNGDSFVVRSAERMTLRQLASLFERTTGKKLKINWGAKNYREREVMVPWEHGNTVPGWQPMVSLAEGIKKCM